MKAYEADALIKAIRSLIDQERTGDTRPASNANPKGAAPSSAAFDEEALYQRFKTRMINDAQLDPVLLHLLTQQPELIVEYERRVETVDTSTLRGRVCKLIAEGFFEQARATSAVRRELQRTGPDPGGGGSLSGQLSDLLRLGFLVREGDFWKGAPGVKITRHEKQLETVG